MDAKLDTADVAPEADDLAEREAAYEKFVWDNLKRNYLGNYLHGMLGMTGFRLVNTPTFLPTYLHQVSGSNAIVGLGLALQQVGGIISPIFGATKVEHRTRVMPAAIWMGSLARLAVLGMAIAGWMLKGSALVGALLLMMLLFGLFMGAQRVVFSLLIAKVIPISRRGRLQAWRNTTGSAIAAVLAYFAGKYFIGHNLFGNGYSTSFTVAFVLTSMGLWCIQFLVKEPQPPTTRARSGFRERFRDLPRLIGQDRSYAFFLLVQMTAVSARIATPFYILYVGQKLHLHGAVQMGATLGLLSTAFMLGDMLSNLVWGHVGDRTGFRLVLLLSLIAWVVATVLLMNVQVSWLIAAAFFGLGAAQAGYNMSAQTMILEFGSRDDLPMRIAVSATAESITATIGPLVGGGLADLVGYDAVFGISLGFLAVALMILIAIVKEPRTARLAV
ncbi:MAG TPA: MFS transporter [Phenylobacterium sp.]|uniref:MFS transporter n=1 Tax=Phenylobacterium sp. TaxID=1871053 RepID=UPI002CC3397D|nr:MFS transporter [Phenylobacterium sp.]HSV03452.1 MFS transporter [Phenylobacterium sp.]